MADRMASLLALPPSCQRPSPSAAAAPPYPLTPCAAPAAPGGQTVFNYTHLRRNCLVGATCCAIILAGAPLKLQCSHSPVWCSALVEAETVLLTPSAQPTHPWPQPHPPHHRCTSFASSSLRAAAAAVLCVPPNSASACVRLCVVCVCVCVCVCARAPARS